VPDIAECPPPRRDGGFADQTPDNGADRPEHGTAGRRVGD
jgi:hypothetical protein